MIHVTKKELPQGLVELEITVPKEDLVQFLSKAALRISQNINIKGFRKGRAPYAVVKQQVGEEGILEEASKEIISQTFYDAVTQEKLETVAQPEIEIKKIAPNNDLIYTAKVALLPQVTLGDMTKIVVEKENAAVTDKEVDDVIVDLRKKRATEKEVLRPAKMGDRVSLDFNVFQANVPIEGGQSSDHAVDLGAGMMIPGFEEQVVGLSAGENREFTLNFPAEYHEKSLAGKPADFKITVKKVLEMATPELTDDFAKSVGKFQNTQELKDQIKNNLQKEREQKTRERQEIDAMKQLVALTTFSDIPEMLIKSEVEEMIQELKSNASRRGMEFGDYLKHLKKTEEELATEFREQAEQRVKSSLVARAVTKQENLTVADDEVEKEVAKILDAYKEYPDLQKQFDNDHYRQYTRNMILYRKVFTSLLSHATEKEKTPEPQK